MTRCAPLILLLIGCSRPQPVKIPDDPVALVELLAISQEPAGNFPIYTVPPPVPAGSAPDNTDYSRDPRFIAQQAAAKLYTLGISAFPELLRHLSDKRQSIAQAPVIPCSLGSACYFIIANQVNPPRSRHDDSILLDGSSSLLTLWWEERKGRTLRDLQIEAQLFSLALAEFDRVENRMESIREWLKENNVDDADLRKTPILEEISALTLPPDDRGRVDAFLGTSQGSFLHRRFATERTRRAWMALYERGAAAFPALIEGMNRAEGGDPCYNLLHHMIDGTSFLEDRPQLQPFSKATLASWLKKREGKSLRDLRVEVARHHLEVASTLKYSSPEEKENQLQFLRYRISEVMQGPP